MLGAGLGAAAVATPLALYARAKRRERLQKQAEAAATNDNVALPRITPDPAEGYADPMQIGASDIGDPDSVPRDNRQEDQTLTPASEARAEENMEGYLKRYFSLGKLPKTRNMPHTDLSAVIRHEMSREQARAHMEAESGLKKTAGLFRRVPSTITEEEMTPGARAKFQAAKKKGLPSNVSEGAWRAAFQAKEKTAGYYGGYVTRGAAARTARRVSDARRAAKAAPKTTAQRISEAAKAKAGPKLTEKPKLASRLDLKFPHVAQNLSRTFSR